VDDESLEGAMILGEEEHSGMMIQGNMEGQLTVLVPVRLTALTFIYTSFTPLALSPYSALLSSSHLRCPSNRDDLLLNRDTDCVTAPEVR
jgi:hypothetical protein